MDVVSEEGPTLVNLAPDLHVGDSIAFRVPLGTSVISSRPLDECDPDRYFSGAASAALLVDEHGVQDPHCSLQRSACAVSITPLRDNALVYVNGVLVTSSDFPLKHNDRVIIGQRAAFRLVDVKTADKRVRGHGSKILDWEMCCEEFGKRMLVLRSAEDVALVEQRVAELEEELDAQDVRPCLCLTGGSGLHNGVARRIWRLPSATGSCVTVGSGCDIHIPSLRGQIQLECNRDSFSLRAASLRKKLTDGASFTVHDHHFVVFVHTFAESTATAPPPINAAALGADHHDNRDIRNAMFDLQFAVLQCFKHFVVPDTAGDCTLFAERRSMLENEQLLEDASYSGEALVRHAQFLTETIRMLHAAPLPPPAVASTAGGAEGAADALYDILREKSARCAVLEETVAAAETTNGSDAVVHTRLWAQESLIGFQASRIAQLESELRHLQEAGESPRPADLASSAMSTVRELVLTFSPVTSARVLQVSTALAKGSFGLLWKRYTAALKSQLDEVANVHCIPDHLKGRVLMAMVDVACAFEFGRRAGALTPEDHAFVAKRAPTWSLAARQCVGSEGAFSQMHSARSLSPAERSKLSYSREPSGARKPPSSAGGRTSRSISPTTFRAAPASTGSRQPFSSRGTSPNIIPRRTPSSQQPSPSATSQLRKPTPERRAVNSVATPTPLNASRGVSARSRSPLLHGPTGGVAGASGAVSRRTSPAHTGVSAGKTSTASVGAPSATAATSRAASRSSADRKPTPHSRAPSPRTLLARSLLSKSDPKPAFK